MTGDAPEMMAAMDGSEAVCRVDTCITQGASAYPITPSTMMSDRYQQAVANGATNMWGQSLFFIQPESEHSAASVCEGYALAGGRVSSFTSGQGLVLMKEVLYTISGKGLPMVFHVGARSISSQALNVHAGHDDIMAVADTGWGILFAGDVQQAHDFAMIARLVSERSQTPFFNVQDGFFTTHTVERIKIMQPEVMGAYVGAPERALRSVFDPQQPIMSGVVQNQDHYMEGRLVQRSRRTAIRDYLQEAFAIFAELTGRRYGLIDMYHMEDAEYALIGLGSVMGTARATVEVLRTRLGIRVGVIDINSFRPFPGAAIAQALRHVRAVTVLERTDNPLADNNPLTLEVKAALASKPTEVTRIPDVYSGVYGLGGRDTSGADLMAAIQSMIADGPRFFSLNSRHETALKRPPILDVLPMNTFVIRGHSIGGYGAVAANRIMATVFAELFGFYVQAYPRHGSEKKGLPTDYHLIAASSPIYSHTDPERADLIMIHDQSKLYDPHVLLDLATDGTVVAQVRGSDISTLVDGSSELLPHMMARTGAKLYVLDALAIARQLAPRPELLDRMQGVVMMGALLRIAQARWRTTRPQTELLDVIEPVLRRQFKRTTGDILSANLQAVRQGFSAIQQISMPLVRAATRSVSEVLA